MSKKTKTIQRGDPKKDTRASGATEVESKWERERHGREMSPRDFGSGGKKRVNFSSRKGTEADGRAAHKKGIMTIPEEGAAQVFGTGGKQRPKGDHRDPRRGNSLFREKKYPDANAPSKKTSQRNFFTTREWYVSPTKPRAQTVHVAGGGSVLVM